MESNIYGISGYQQASSWQKTENKKAEGKDAQKTTSAKSADETKRTDQVSTGTGTTQGAGGVRSKGVKISQWKPLDTASSLVPKNTKEYGMAIGDVQLSDKAKDYYAELKKKFGDMNFIVVSKDMKAQVQANAAAYGTSSGSVVLIDDEKLEKMATDVSYRKKYEGMISLYKTKLPEMKQSLANTGVSVKNFGITVGDNGAASFFATVDADAKTNAEAAEKRLEKKQATKAKEKKAEAKRTEAKRAEKRAEARKEEAARQESRLENGKKAKENLESKPKDQPLENVDQAEETAVVSTSTEAVDGAENHNYVQFNAPSFDALISQLSKYAYDHSSKGTLTQAEKSVGQNFDFAG
ncbi:MAG: DUF6033 family protein [Lachnospiraceae bacterium]|nr:DUF6033 family protein [Lachnospiraceae bacterium]